MPRRAYSWTDFSEGLSRGSGTAWVIAALIAFGGVMAIIIWTSTNKNRKTRR